MTGVPHYHTIMIHVRHQQESLLAEARHERRVAETARGEGILLPTSWHVAFLAGVLLLALLLAVSVASA